MVRERGTIVGTAGAPIAGLFLVTMVLLPCWAEGSAAASANDTKNRSATPSSARRPATTKSSATSTRVDQLLQQLMQARSLEHYDSLLKNATLTPSEETDLKTELAKPQYVSKQEGLFRSAKRAAEADAKSKAKRKSQEIAKTHQQRLTSLNRQANEHHQRALNEARAAAQAKASRAPTGVVKLAARAPVSREGLPHITSLSSPITPGVNNLGIVGENFREPGEEMGTVSLTIGDYTADLPVISYSSVAIQARIPPHVCDVARREIPSVLEGGVIEGRVGVHTPRGTSVGVVQLNIPIDESQLDPVIGIVYPREIQPGQRVSILGEKFLSREPGSVRFHFGSRTIEATIVDWASVGVLVELPSDVSGMRQTPGTVEVTNWVGRSDIANATFVPIDVTEELFERFLLGSPDPRHSEIASGSRVLFDFDLINGWKVADRWWQDVGAWCENRQRPELGSSNPRYSFFCETDFMVDCMAWVVVQGPRGLPYRR